MILKHICRALEIFVLVRIGRIIYVFLSSSLEILDLKLFFSSSTQICAVHRLRPEKLE